MSVRSNVMTTICGITLVVITGCKGKISSGAPDSGISAQHENSAVADKKFSVGNWESASGHITFDIRADGTLDYCGQDKNGSAVMKSCETGTWVSVPNDLHQISVTSNRGTVIVKLDEYRHPEDIDKANESGPRTANTNSTDPSHPLPAAPPMVTVWEVEAGTAECTNPRLLNPAETAINNFWPARKDPQINRAMHVALARIGCDVFEETKYYPLPDIVLNQLNDVYYVWRGQAYFEEAKQVNLPATN